MLLMLPQNSCYRRSAVYRRLVGLLSSERWSICGFLALAATVIPGQLQSAGGFAALILLHCFCDTNDGFVYRSQEQGRLNGYGLYLDHMLDAIGAAFVAFAGYKLVGQPWLILATLVLFYLIAIHAWLIKIVNVAAGQAEGLDFWIPLTKAKPAWRLGPDDLAVVLAALALSRGNVALFGALIATLSLLLAVRVTGAIRQLRARFWRPGTPA